MLKFLAPWRPGGARWQHYHIILTAALIVALVGSFTAGFGLGYRSGAEHNAAYYRATYQAPLAVPTVKEAIQAPRAAVLPASAGISFSYFNAQINDQFTLGSCQAWAFSKQLSYAYNRSTHHYRFYSPRYAYDAISYGQDQGSYLEQYPPVAQQGIPTWSQMPYGPAASTVGLAPYALEYPIPAVFQAQARAHPFQVTERQLWGYTTDAGMGGVAALKTELAKHNMVNIDFPVYPEYDRANADGSTVTVPPAGEQSRGGHANAAVEYDDNHDNGDGSRGAILASNQWSWSAGVGKDGLRHTDGTHNGYVWMSYGFVAKYVFGVAVLDVPAQPGHIAAVPAPSTIFVPNHAPKQSIVPEGYEPKPTAGAAAWYVHGVYTRDTGVNITDAINAAGDRYGVSPVGLTATLANESAIRQYADRYGECSNPYVYCDESFGGAQFTWPTAQGYGVCSGAAGCKAWLDNIFNSIELEARFFADIQRETCTRFPNAYVGYNAGPGYGCGAGIYSAPCAYNSTACQAYTNFLGNYSYVLSTYGGGSPPAPPKPPKPPKPAPFPRKAWCAWATGHHRGCPAIYEKHGGRYHLTWAASLYPHRTWLRGKLPYTRDRFTRARKPSGSGYMNYHWVKGQATCWVKWHRCSVHRA